MEKNIPQSENGNNSVGRIWWISLVVPPLMLFVLPTIISQFLFQSGGSLPDFVGSFSEGSDIAIRHMGERLIYIAMVYFHVAVCITAVVIFWSQLRDASQRTRQHIFAIIVCELLFFLLLRIFWPRPGIVLYELSYLNIKGLLNQSKAAADITIGATSKLSVLVNVPQGFGAVATIVAFGVATALSVNLFQEPDAKWQQTFANHVARLHRCFIGLSAVLVTSTLNVMLFFQLPVELSADPKTKNALLDYARGLTFFWGRVYTLTLVAVFVPAVLILRSTLHRYEHGLATPAEFREWLTRQVFVSPRRTVESLIAMMAPIIAGVLGTFLKSIAAQ